MAVHDLFSKRQKRVRGETSDVYQYTDIPNPFKVQVLYIVRDALGDGSSYHSGQMWQSVHATLCREYGKFQLADRHTPEANVAAFLMSPQDYECVLDTIELLFQIAVYAHEKQGLRSFLPAKISASEAIRELNTRFREHELGYQFESGELVRVDSQFLHSEAVKPTLDLLSEPEYSGANAEFLQAFEHYRKGQIKACLNECLKAFESTMKAICSKRHWGFKNTDTASALINVCFKNGLIPSLIQSHITGVRSSLESGIPTIRNKMSGHGQGAQVVDVPMHYASYMLHLTATTIKFLIESEKALK